MAADPLDESFPPTSGRVTGMLGLGVGVGIIVLGVLDSFSLVAVGLGLLFIGLAWTTLLRPGVAIESDDLVLRNLLATVRLPLAALDEVVVRQVLVVRAGDKRYISPAVGRSRRQLSKEGMGRGALGVREGGAAAELAEGQAFAVFVQERIRERAEEARVRAGVRRGSAEQDALAAQVRRTPAVAEIAWLVGSCVVVVVGLSV